MQESYTCLPSQLARFRFFSAPDAPSSPSSRGETVKDCPRTCACTPVILDALAAPDEGEDDADAGRGGNCCAIEFEATTDPVADAISASMSGRFPPPVGAPNAETAVEVDVDD